MEIRQLQQYPLGRKGVKIQHFDQEREVDSVCWIEELSVDEITVSNGEYEYWLKPALATAILYPLSALTKEIEVYGERFVPIIEIAKRVDNGHNSNSIIKEYTGLILVKTDKCDDCENVYIRHANGELLSITRGDSNVTFKTYTAIIQLLQSWFINYQGIEAVNPFDLNENPYK
ncbi:MAG: hypothetical protein KF862_07470 [Chitinophagaceae bacterium]|nr:hypothetical protein [Chitinophagaceae bacterium]